MSGNAERRRRAAVRAQYTEEPRGLAARGVARGSLGLDVCKPEQRRFRAIMAVFLLNTLEVPPGVRLGGESVRVARSGVSRLTWSPILISAQVDDLSILTQHPDHLVQCVSRPGDSSHGVPGLRAESVEGQGEALVMRHLPTGAALRFRYYEHWNPRRREPPWFYPANWERLTHEQAVRPQEQGMLDIVPRMHDDAERLLAGLTTRLTCWHRGEGWAVSRLIHDDLSRGLTASASGWPFVHLWGDDSEWVLRWGGDGAVPAGDVARALTHDVVGVVGAICSVAGSDRAEVRLGRARLVLEVFQVAPWHFAGPAVSTS